MSRGKWASGIAAFAAALAWTAAVRLPLLGRDGPDDAFYAAVAHLWTQGALPYAAVYDIKPPGFFALLALAQTLLGPGLAALRTLAVVSDAASAAALFFIGRRLGAPALGIFAAGLFPALSEIAAADDAYCPLMASTALAFAAALSTAPLAKRAAWAGLAIGAALTIKQTAAFEALALLAILLRAPDALGQRRLAALAFALAATLAPAATLAYFAWHGAADALIGDVVVFALARPGLVGFPLFAILLSFGLLIMPALPAFARACAAMARIRWRAPDEAAWAGVGLWFAAACLGALIQHATANNYVAPILAPCLLLAGRGIAAAPKRLAPLALFTVGVAIACRFGDLVRPFDAAALAGAAAQIKARGAAPDDKLFVIDYGAWLYSATGLAPPTAFIHPIHLLCRFPNAGPARLKQALAARPRFVVIGARDGAHGGCVPAANWNIVTDAVAGGYRRFGQAIGAHEAYDLYEAAAPEFGDAALRPGFAAD